jgi:ribose-phosphate pyrophosphokinase
VGTLKAERMERLSGGAGPLAAVQQLRGSIDGWLARALPEPEAGLAAGILVGLRERVSGEVSGDLVIGPVAGRHAVVVDDLISAGTTILRAVHACRAAGALSVTAFATHGVFAPGAERLLGPDGPDRLYVTDTLLPTRLAPPQGGDDKLVVLPASALFAEALRRIGAGESVVALREMERKPRSTPP